MPLLFDSARWLGLVLLAASWSASVLSAQAPGGREVQAADQATELQGWHATYRDAEGREVHGRTLHAAFQLEGVGDSLHAAAGVVGQAVDFETLLAIEDGGSYRFALETEAGDGELLLATTDGERLAGAREWVRLEPGQYALHVRFDWTRPAPPRLRTLWELQLHERGGFRPEPIPARATRLSRAAVAATSADERALRGRVLLERKGCTNCHLPPETAEFAVGRRKAPLLGGIGSRVAPTWIDRWLHSPAHLRPGADMPLLLPGNPEGERMLGALLQYLCSLEDEGDDERAAEGGVATEPGVLRAGRELFHARGCIACHGALASAAEVYDNDLLSDELPLSTRGVRPPAPFGDVRGKWRPSALASFLADPVAVYPDGRMPSMNLSAQEADLIATYLVSEWGAADMARELDPVEVGFGRQVFIMSACAACHPMEQVGDGLAAAHAVELPLLRLDPFRGCLDPANEVTPRYDLDEDERDALRAGLDSVARATGLGAPLDEARRAIQLAGCLNCHPRGAEGGVDASLREYFVSAEEDVDLGDEGRFPPDLHDPGMKLTTNWARQVLLEGGVARPYLGARMPQYGEELVGDLPARLARLEGVLPDTDVEEPVATDELVLTGRALMPRTALGCVACHVYKEYPPAGAPGPAITQFGERLRYEWYRAYIANPQRTKPGSRMPSFGRGAQSTLTSVLGGDLFHQADAMWAYFTLGDEMPAPEGVEPDNAMQLDVGDRPIVLRAFLEGAGSRGIAVGTPLGVHYAFDAETARFAYVWRGDFLDAAGSWAGRGGTIVGGQGDVVWTAPAERPFWFGALDEAAEWPAADRVPVRFGGYRLDADGQPSFLYELAGVSVEERIELSVAEHLAVIRKFRLAGLPPGGELWIRADPDVDLAVLDQDLRSEPGRVRVTARADGRYEFSLWYLAP